MSQSDILLDVRIERERQDGKWGPVATRRDQLDRWMAILGEEFGEACRCVLEMHPLQQRIHGDWRGKLRKELIQIAAVAVALIEKMDAE